MNLVTGKVRFSYVSVFEPRAVNGGEEKYSVTLLIPKSDTNTYQRIVAEINKTLQENVSDTFKGVMPANPNLPLYDGDGVRPSGEPFGLECKGHWVISAKSNSAPEVVDANCNPIMSKNDFYSGCYGRASIRFYAYNQNGNKGVGCGLGNVQKLEDGQPLDGRTTAAEDFGAPIQNNFAMPTQNVAMPTTPVQNATYQFPVTQAPIQNTAYQTPAPTYIGEVNPVTGQPLQPTVNNIYGVN